MTRKPYGVWLLLETGEQWMFGRYASLDQALRIARTFRLSLMAQSAWIAAPRRADQ